MSSEKVMYQIKNIDKTLWRSFRAKCIMSGFDSINECLATLITMYAKDEIDAVKK